MLDSAFATVIQSLIDSIRASFESITLGHFLLGRRQLR